jgi:hypothetical protein
VNHKEYAAFRDLLNIELCSSSIQVPDKCCLEILELFKLQHPRTLINYIVKLQSFSAAVSVTLINDFMKLERFSVATTMTLLN